MLSEVRVSGLGFRVWGVGFRVCGLGSRGILACLSSPRAHLPHPRGSTCSEALGRRGFKREFPKIGATLFWGPYNKDPII